jgi:hypothetical protein
LTEPLSLLNAKKPEACRAKREWSGLKSTMVSALEKQWDVASNWKDEDAKPHNQRILENEWDADCLIISRFGLTVLVQNFACAFFESHQPISGQPQVSKPIDFRDYL